MFDIRKVVLVLLTLAMPLAASADDLADVIGRWKGEITLPTTALEIIVVLSDDDGDLAGTIDIPVQALRGHKLSEVSLDKKTITFQLPGIPGSPTFNGTVGKDDKTISGTFKQAGQSLPFQLSRTDEEEPKISATPANGVPGDGLVGVWQGSIKVQVFELRIVLHVGEDDGVLSATVDSLDQGVTGIKVSQVAIEDRDVSLELKKIAATFAGKMSDDGAEIEGEWKQGGQTMPLVFKRLAEAPVVRRPQEPQAPFPYEIREVTFPNENAGIKLAGTLTVPSGEGRHPAVILLSGSGPQDRDEALMGHRPFFVLADFLTRSGVAVLRYDDRGFAESEGDFGESNISDFVDDAEAAVKFMKTVESVDGNNLGLVGHSEGGLVAPRVAVESDDVAFIVLLAGPGVPLDQLLARQAKDIVHAMGGGGESMDREFAIQAGALKMVVDNVDADNLKQIVRDYFKAVEEKYSDEELEQMGFDSEKIDAQLDMLATPWFRELIATDPRPVLQKLNCPVLAVCGEKDTQVAAAENLEAIETALKNGGNQDYKIVEFSDLNHLFQKCKTGAPTEYSQIEETFNPFALETIANWINAHVSVD